MLVLRQQVDDMYEKLDSEEALTEHQEDDSTREVYVIVMKYAGGIPLALKVLSSFRYGKRLENWDAELIKLKECQNKQIMNILRTSYDGLDEMQQCVFLDVACFPKTNSENT